MRRAPVIVPVLAVVLLGALAAGRSAPHGAAQEDSPAVHPLVGTWRVFLGDAPAVHGLLTHAADGTMVSSDPVAAPAPPGAPFRLTFLSAAHGVWEPTGPDSAAYTFQQLVADESGHLVAVVTIRGTRQVSADGQTFISPYEFTVADPAGAVVDAGSGTVRGERLGLEPMTRPMTPAVSPAAGTPTP